MSNNGHITWTNTKVRLGDLRPWEHNPRQMTKKQAKKLADSWGEFGQVETIAVGPGNEVYNGHQRLNVLTALHGKDYEIDARQASRALTEAERRQLVVMLHAGATGEWSWDALAGWDAGELQAWGFDGDLLENWKRDVASLGDLLESEEEVTADPGAQIDKAAELQEKWQVKRGDLWQCGRHRLLCGDSTSAEDVERVMQGEKADCVFTSPPYALGIEYGTYQDTIGNLRGLLTSLSEISKRVICDGGYTVINFGDMASGRELAQDDKPCEYPMALEHWPIFRAAGWRLWSRRVWCKPNIRVYAPWTITTNRAATDFEYIWTWVLDGKPLDIRNGEIDRCGWFDTTHEQGVDVGKDIHGAGMAVGCATRMIRVHSFDSGIVFEPYLGTGTTLVACEQTGRIGRGIEIEPKYVAVSLQRLSDMGLECKLIENGS